MPLADIPLRHLEATDSTNSEALRQFRAGERGPLWIVANEQTAGRGRSGRDWRSAPGNFYGSLLLTLDAPAQVAHQLSLVTGVAVYDAVAATARPGQIDGLRLKWPNDLLIGDAKLAGILAESSPTHDGALAVVLGIGINVASAPDDLGRAVTSLDRVAVASSPAALVRPLSNALSVWLARWRRGSGFDEVRSAWLERAGPIGEMLTVRTGATTSGGPDDHPSGRFAGLAEDGALLLTLVDGAVRRITWGDVTLGTGKPALDRYDGSAGEGCRQSGAGQ